MPGVPGVPRVGAALWDGGRERLAPSLEPRGAKASAYPQLGPHSSGPPPCVSPIGTGRTGESPDISPFPLGKLTPKEPARASRGEATRATGAQGRANDRGKSSMGRGGETPEMYNSERLVVESHEIDPNDNCSGTMPGTHPGPPEQRRITRCLLRGVPTRKASLDSRTRLRSRRPPSTFPTVPARKPAPRRGKSLPTSSAEGKMASPPQVHFPRALCYGEVTFFP